MPSLFLSLLLPALSLASRQHIHREYETMQMQLLQHKLILEGVKERSLKEAQPLEWVHFPKTGSSFVNTIAHLAGTCPSLGKHAINEDTVGGGACWLSRWFEERCPQECHADRYVCQQSSLPHVPIAIYSARRGHLVGMFRNPDQRILSAYHDEANNFAAEDYGNFLIDTSHHEIQQNGGNCTGSVVRGLPKRPLLDFARTWKGGVTYQLTADNQTMTALHPRRPRVTRRDATEAARRVHDGFAFVGITEEWDLSICLFHKMFGGACNAFEFEDTRPSYDGKSADQDYDTAQLQGWHDDIDEVVYAAALEVFRRNLASFSVSHETCQECYGHKSSASSQGRRGTSQ
ncbi:hypothetical protein AK812_SmicGene16759 [Symbiodinium microadriaticum]|uniref:Uncharacterized protein n=1 Tax=Symbiodinium microadriaticum TaxID=2951 RepID=A0A1Q9DZH4_SYMMI|nr:hypothetical protein AK812_SmicGene16759 [Symbiodinium microadriaticum]